MAIDDLSTRNRRPALVVGVGASAGGLRAFKALLASLPADTGMAFVLVQHLDPHHQSRLSELLEASTAMSVRPAEHNQILRPDCVYVIPPGTALAVKSNRLVLSEPEIDRGVRRPVDHLLRSLASEFGPRAAAVILSGAGSDGRDGVRELKSVGGLAIAQSLDTAEQIGMPKSAIEAGADLILPIAEIPEALERFEQLPLATRTPATRAPKDERERSQPRRFGEGEMDRLEAALRRLLDFDADDYKPRSLERRVLRRMALADVATLDDYLEHLRDSEDERRHLRRDLHVSVTRFFRDPPAFEALERQVLRPLVEQAQDGDELRVWVAGCATGEEAYTVAMLLLAAADAVETRVELRIFATDVDAEALKVARAGRYFADAPEQIPAPYLERFFEERAGPSYQLRQRLRDCVSFAKHDLCKDPPFSRTHLVCCRNLLIYLRPEAQRRVLEQLHYALRPAGHLFLGTAESLGPNKPRFAAVSRRWRIFRKVGPYQRLPLQRRDPASANHEPEDQDALPNAELVPRPELARQALLAACVPPSVLVRAGEVIFMHGDLRPYLRLPQGEPRHELSALIDPAIATRARAAIYKCASEASVVSVPARLDDETRVRLTARPAPSFGEGAAVLSFELATEPGARRSGEAELRSQAGKRDDAAIIDQLQAELEATREDLNSTVEELESSNEELRASNEESMSMNEELQSANEELEATTEELRSLNEELSTVNKQLREKVDELEQANDDISNFFASTNIATLFLDEALRIKRFTPAAASLLRLDEGDIGRRVDSVAGSLLQSELADEARAVLEDLGARHRELESEARRWIARRVLPYLSEARRVAGVVVTFIDITELKTMAGRLEVRRRQQSTIATLGLRALAEGELQSFLDYAVREIQQTLDSDFCKILELQPGGEQLLLRAGVNWGSELVGQALVPADVGSQAGFTLQTHEPVLSPDLDEEQRFASPALLREHGVRSGMSCIIGELSSPYGVLGVHFDEARDFSSEDSYFLQSMATVIAHAITRHQTQLRLALEGAAARAFAQAEDLDEGVASLHQTFVREAGACASELWWPNPDAPEELRCRSLFVDMPCEREAIEAKMIAGRSFAQGEGAVGRVWESGRAQWLSMGGADFVRKHEARGLNLISGLAFPLVAHSQVLGVMVVFAPTQIIGESTLLRGLESIGRSLADFVLRQRTADALAASEQRFRQTFANAAVGISHKALDGRWLRVNERMCEIVGYSREELLAMSFQEVSDPEGLAEELELLEALKAGEIDDYSLEKRYLHKRGETIWAHVTLSLCRDAEGEPDYFIAVVEDISARKRVERGLAQLAAIVDNSDDAILSTDAEGRIQSWNRGAERIYGYSADEMLGQSALRLWPEDDPELPFEADGRPLEHEETRHLRKDGEEVDVSLSVFPLPHADGPLAARTPTVFAIIARDIRETKRVERQLKRADQQKNEFLAMLGHELRNPLSAVRNAASLLEHLPEGRVELERIQETLTRQTAHMAKLLDGLLDVSRIIRGKIELEREPVNLGRVIEQVIDDARPRAAKLDVRLRLSEEPVWVEGDVVRLTQVIDNLVSNAIKFTPPPGRVDIELRRVDGKAVLEVRDTGRGIEPELLPEIFQIFRQASQGLDRAAGGLGLGLALVKLLVELHGGRVQASSAGPELGARFVVELPLSSAGQAEPEPAADAGGPRRILVVEDNEDVAALMAELLNVAGHETRVAHSGAEAFAALEDFDAEVLLCDLGLPDDLSGFDIAKRLRSEGRSDLLMIAISGYGRPEDRADALQAGFDAHLTKPVELAAVERLLAEH